MINISPFKKGTEEAAARWFELIRQAVIELQNRPAIEDVMVSNYTLITKDNRKIKRTTGAGSAYTITIPPNIFPLGSIVEIMRYDADAVTINAGTGVTLNNSFATNTIGRQYGLVKLIQVAKNIWTFSGDGA